MKLSKLGERAIIGQIQSRFMKGVELNDCALIDNGDEYILVSTDLASTHTNIPAGTRPELMGKFAASINLSDIAAMAGIPVGMAVSLAVDPETDSEILYRIMEGIERTLHEFNADLIGGDTKEGPGISITGTAIGRQRKDRVLTRSNLKAGQLLCVTGKLGRAASGYVYYKSGYSRARGIEYMLDVSPRIREAQIIAGAGGRFMTDLSDGLFSSLNQLKSSHGIGAKLVEDEIPLHKTVRKATEISGATPTDIAAGFGGDYELLFTIENSMYSEFKEKMKVEGIEVSYIGETWEGDNIIFNGENWNPVTSKGYEHFQKAPKLGAF